ncbi:MAG TPA: hypothetical protein VLJ59_08565 [Mycobacteriales bacterium]|nr:hypothetical protein [Mycobacteriales bacterium]
MQRFSILLYAVAAVAMAPGWSEIGVAERSLRVGLLLGIGSLLVAILSRPERQDSDKR